jgi:hypothetical protein
MLDKKNCTFDCQYKDYIIKFVSDVRQVGDFPHTWPRKCSFCCNHNPVFFRMTYHQFCSKRNPTGVTSGAYPSATPEFILGYSLHSVVFTMLQSERNFFLFSWNSWKHNYENDVITSAVGNWYTCITKTWKIPKKYSEAVKGRTDITVAKRKHTTQKCIKDWETRTGFCVSHMTTEMFILL